MTSLKNYLLLIRYLMDDDKLMRDIDFSHFEEEFKLSTAPVVKKGVNDTSAPDGAQTGVTNGTGTIRKTPTRQLDTLMEHTRLKNMAICRRKLPNIPVQVIVTSDFNFVEYLNRT